MAEPLIRDRRDGGVRSLTIDRPPVNVQTIAVLVELAAALRTIGDADRLLVLSGAGPHFSAGVDVAEHLPPAGAAMLDAVESLFEVLAGVPIPTLAVVRGACLGGGFELALACDLVLAADDARFALPEIRLGCFPPIAAEVLPERLGGALARDLLMTGRELDGRSAAALGLVSRSVPEADLERTAGALAAEVAALSPIALRALKKVLRRGGAFRVYREEVLHSPEAAAGLQGFLDRRRVPSRQPLDKEGPPT